MSTAKKTASKTAKPQEATTMLRADHKLVLGLFEEFDKTKSASKKKKLVAEICKELTIHTQLEDEIFYPAFQQALKDHELVPEGLVEHQSVKDLIALVDGVEPGGDEYTARVKVMGELVEHHIKEEHRDMFPKAKKSKLDLVELGERMFERKQELMADYK